LRITPDLELSKEGNDSLCTVIQFDDAAFESLFRNNFTALCSYCQFRFGFDSDSAKEAVHTAFMRLWESRQNLSADLSIKGYLYKTMGNICLDMLRHERVKRKHEGIISRNNEDDAAHSCFQTPDIKYLAFEIDKAVSELPDQMRKIFELSRYNGLKYAESRYDGLKYAEISCQLNISVKTVETQMSRALAKLREKLSGYLSLLVTVFFITA
jgi:RNA polymerase sigma-70 factor, ECF subfamily